MDILIYILIGAIVLLCGIAFEILRRLVKISDVEPQQPLLGVVAPQKPQDGSESIKTLRKVK